jgi:hypothetical protein
MGNNQKTPKNERNQSGELSRRNFLLGAGSVIVGSAIGTGILSGCKGETTTLPIPFQLLKPVRTTTIEVHTTESIQPLRLVTANSIQKTPSSLIC